MTTDYRALCAELVDIATAHCNPDDFAVGYCAAVLARARAALTQPEPEGPTDEELLAAQDQAVASFPPIHPDAETLSAVEYARELEIRKARAVLARWGRPAIKPVPVSERPWEREGWCDANEKCWWWNPAANTLGTPWWSYEPWEWVEDAAYSLPHHALPVPQP